MTKKNNTADDKPVHEGYQPKENRGYQPKHPQGGYTPEKGEITKPTPPKKP